jgi:hypothetical protein
VITLTYSVHKEARSTFGAQSRLYLLKLAGKALVDLNQATIASLTSEGSVEDSDEGSKLVARRGSW